jgi:hypothetical protein
MVASPPSIPSLLGVEAFSTPSRVLSTRQRLPLSFGCFPTAASGQRINTNTILLHAASAADGNDGEEDDGKSANKSSSDGDEPAPSATAGAEDEVSRQLAKAKELIERTKQKMEKKEEAAATAASKDDGDAKETTGTVSNDDDDDDVLPFFAVDPTAAEKRRELVTKTKDEESGLITTDGEKMASLAEGEKWESRGLYDLFENEREEDEETLQKEARASRDVARSMMGLKMIMNKEDFDAIFDKRNRFIGEE